MKFVTYAVEDTEQYNYYPRRRPVGVMDKWAQTIEKHTGKDAVGNTMQQLIDTYKKGGELIEIARLVGQKKYHPHGDCQGDESQINLQNKTVSAVRILSATAPVQYERFRADLENIFS